MPQDDRNNKYLTYFLGVLVIALIIQLAFVSERHNDLEVIYQDSIKQIYKSRMDDARIIKSYSDTLDSIRNIKPAIIEKHRNLESSVRRLTADSSYQLIQSKIRN